MKKGLFLLMFSLVPINVLAYSSEVYLGGQTIGIDAEADGVLVVGFYKVDGTYNETNPQITEGDYITKVNGEEVTDILSMSQLIEKYASDETCELTVRRNDEEFKVILDIIKDGNTYKTGIYVKDSITGIGTITYIDPENMLYGALGHEIIESNTQEMIEVSGGTIFENSITSIDKSVAGTPGSKNASFNYDNIYGEIYINTSEGIYGEYTSSVDDYELISVGTSSEVEIGPAQVYTVTDDQTVEIYDIYITKINETSDVKNLTIEITDEELLDLTGGVVQGMSGSPIIQNGKLIGALTHVIIDNPTTGYGIFIENMLENSDEITS